MISEETRRKMSEAEKAKRKVAMNRPEVKAKISAANKGKKRSAEVKSKMSAARKGRKQSEEWVKKRVESFKKHYENIPKPMEGKKHTEEAKRKQREGNIGKIVSEESKAKNRVSTIKWHENNPHPKGMKGKKQTEEAKRKIMEGNKGLKAGEKNPQWQGGISFEPYGIKFNNGLRCYIRELFNYRCQLCGVKEQKGKSNHSCHHIDSNKRNNDISNFTLLCENCHGLTKPKFVRTFWEFCFSKRNYTLIKRVNGIAERYKLFRPNIMKLEEMKLLLKNFT